MATVAGDTPEKDERPVVVRLKRKVSQYKIHALWLEVNERSLKRALLDFEKLSISECSASIAVDGGSLNNVERPVVVGVKREASQSRLDGLEISERPSKRTFLDLGNLSVSESSASIVEALKTRKVLLCHVKTVANSEVTFDVLQSVVPASADASKFENKSNEIRHTFKAKDKHDRLLAKAKPSQEVVSKNARFIQIGRSRKSKKEATKEAMHDELLHEKCQFYDVVRVDFEETTQEILDDLKRDSELDDHKLMSQYLPLLKETLPSAAMEIESEISISILAQSDGFVYDIYAVTDEMNISELDVATLPLVQVDADDSNAENNSDDKSPGETNEDDTSKAQSEIDWSSDDDDDDDDEEEDWE